MGSDEEPPVSYVREGPLAGSENGPLKHFPTHFPRRISMRVHRRTSLRVLFARLSILLVSVLGVSVPPARGQSSTLNSVPPKVPAVKAGDSPTKAADEASSAAKLEQMQSTINRLEMRVKELENKLDKGAADATPSVVTAKPVKEEALTEDAVKENVAKAAKEE